MKKIIIAAFLSAAASAPAFAVGHEMDFYSSNAGAAPAANATFDSSRFQARAYAPRAETRISANMRERDFFTSNIR